MQFLSMKIAASNPVVSFDIVEDLFGRQLKQACSPAAALSAMALPPAAQLEPSCLQMSPMQQVHPSAAAGGSTGFGLDMVVNNLYAPAAATCPVSAAPSVSVAAGPSTIEPCLNVCCNHSCESVVLESAATSRSEARTELSALCCFLQVNGTAAWDIGSQNLFSGFDAQFQSGESE